MTEIDRSPAPRRAHSDGPERVCDRNAQLRLLDTLAARFHQSDGTLSGYCESLRLKPDDAETWNKLAAALAGLDLLEEAARCYRASLEARPMAVTYFQLAHICSRRMHLHEAVLHYRHALALEPRRVEIHNNLGNTLRHLGRYEEAQAAFEEALRINPAHPMAYETHTNLGLALYRMGRLEQAQKQFQCALALNPGYQRAVAGTANVLRRQGAPEQAYGLVQPFLQSGEANASIALALAAMCVPLQRCGQTVVLIERLLAGQGPPLDAYERIMLHFAAGRLLDAAGEYDRAFGHYRRGNVLAKRRFDPSAHKGYIDELIRTYTPELMAQAAASPQSPAQPVFIVGMPRSGTSLVEQILATHPQLFGAGELEEMNRIVVGLPALPGSGRPYPQCVQDLTPVHRQQLAERYLEQAAALAPPEALRIADKMPDNFQHLGLIALLFPRARIIHCVRDPLDTCLSCYFQDFSLLAYSNDLGHLGAYYRQYQRLMAHWRKVSALSVMDVHYEDLVADQEGVSRAIIEFCGLEWDERCLRFHETRRVVATASYDQVRRPLYSSSVGRWRHYAEHLGPLQQALAGRDGPPKG